MSDSDDLRGDLPFGAAASESGASESGAGEAGLGAAATDSGIAIIGLSCRFPGAPDPETFWRDLAAGRSRIRSMAEDENLGRLGVGPRDRADDGVIRSFGVLDDIDRFDADLFGIPPRRAARLDPQQRLLLELAWHALENAGYGDGAPETVTGAFVGLTNSGYFPARAEAVDDAVFDLTAGEKDYAATRIAHKLGLTGPAMVVQSACSSALLAVHTACEALIGGQCDMAIAGGASITLPQGAYRHLPGLMMSPRGRCRTFDAAADGTVPGNGAGLVVLKPLARALADGDPIRAVIRGSAANNDGAVKADYLAPSVSGQALAVGEALAVSGLDPAEIGYVEAHATGTRLGDPIEVQALSHVFADLPRDSIALGSVKASIGHLNAASGIAGLIKAVLALEHATLPPVPGFETPNPEILFAETPFRVPAAAEPWPRGAGPRAAGVSSFGFGGTNVHVVLQEAPPPAPRAKPTDGPVVLALSALTEERLTVLGAALAEALAADPDLRLDDMALTLAAGRRALPVRRVAVVADRAAAIAWLHGTGSGVDLPPAVRRWLDGETADLAIADLALAAPAGARRVALPGYPFAPQRHWCDLVGRMPAATGLAWMDGTDVVAKGAAAPALVAAGDPGRSPRQAAQDLAVGLMAEALGRDGAEIDPAAPLASFALDSLLTVGITNRLKERFPALRDTALFEQESLESLAAHLADAFPVEAGALPAGGGGDTPAPAPAVPDSARSRPAEGGPIAVIAMAGRYPDAPDLDRFWENLREGRSALRDVPADRWSADDFTDAGRADRSTVRTGGFLADVDRFEPVFFGIAPKEARLMDPQQRLFLEVAWQAIEEAGYTPAALKAAGAAGTMGNVGVFVGAMNQPYRLIGLPATAAGKVVQSGHWSVANRLSYHLDLTGPSLAVDTACSASLTAVHLACASLARGECGVAIAGGVNLVLHPLQQLELARMGMLSPSDLCRPFADGADGTLQGEGVGAVVLKPLDRAVADGDVIRAVIRGSAIDAGGRTAGYTVPNPNAQRRAIEVALGDAGIDPATIAHVECHGTGTDLGDPIEANALADALGPDRETVLIASVKGNIGHLESAAGIAGLSKLVLEIEAGEVAPNVTGGAPSARIDFARQRLLVCDRRQPWPARRDPAGDELPRRGGVSSFGAGGANAHVVVEQAPAAPPRAAAPPGPIPLLLMARDPARLPVIAARLADRIEILVAGEAAGETAHEVAGRALLADIAFTLAVGRVAHEHRALVSAEGVADAIARLRAFDTEVVTATPDEIAAGLGAGRRRVALPGYPFAGASYWVEGAARPVPIPADGAVLPGAVPLATGEAESGSRLRIAADAPVIDQHRVRGRPTLPGVASVLAAMRAAGKGVTGARDVVWLRPLTAADGGLEVSLSTEGDRFELHGPDGLACRGRLSMPAMPPAPDLPAGGETLASDEFYDRLLETGLDYRGAYRPVTSVRVSADAVAATLSPAVVGDGFHDWPLPPPLLDAALQAAAALTLPRDGAASRTLVPFSAGAIDLAPDSGIRWRAATTILARRAEGEVGDRTERYDAAILTGDGRMLASVRGLVARAAGKGAPTAETPNLETPAPETPAPPATAIGDWAFRPVWRAVPLAAGPVPARAVVIAGAGGHALAGRLASRIARADVRSLDGDPRELAAAVSAAGHLVLAVGPSGDGSAPPLAELALLRALKSAALLDPIALRLVTVGGEHPSVAAVTGLVRVAAQEARRWSVACVAVEAGAEAAVLDAALGDPGDPAGREIRYVAAGREIARLERVTLPSPAAPVWRAGGHVAILGGAGGVGAALAESLAARFQARLTLIGRSAENDDIRALLARIAAAGGAAVYVSADAGEPGALAAALAEGRAANGPVRAAVHSAIVMDDRALERMDDDTFTRAFAVKAAGTLALANATREDPLDVLALFSSANSFAAMPGQANYVAGCLAKDAIGHRLAAAGRPVLIVNWGFWGEVGRVATPDYRARLQKSGVEPLTTAEGLDAIDRALSGPVVGSAEGGGAAGQVLVLKATDETLAKLGVETGPARETNAALGGDLAKAGAEYDALDRIARDTVARWLADQGVLGAVGSRFRLAALEETLRPAARHSRLVDALVDMLARDGTLAVAGGGLSVAKPIPEAAAIERDREAQLSARPAYRAHLDLLDACLAAYGAVLRDERPATEVLFPGGGLDLVSPMYVGNPMVDAFNARAAEACVGALAGGGRGSVLEFGGGTGSLTSALIPRLDAIGGIARYRFTDLSLGFCRAAEARFAAGRPWLETGLLDISRDPGDQGTATGAFDVVVGANVIHATPSIADSLANARALLKPGGTLVLYEMMTAHDFVTVTFGLLDGWWAAADARLPHTPLLDADLWRTALTGAGFEAVEIIDGSRHGVAVARVPAAASRVEVPAAVPPAAPAPRPETSRNPLIRKREGRRAERAVPAASGTDTLTRAAEAVIADALADALELPAQEIRPDRAFADLGTDSILSVDVVAALNDRLGIELKPTILFSHTTVAALASHLAEIAADALGGTEARVAEIPAPAQAPLVSTSAAPAVPDDAIAIIGMSGRFPGSDGLDGFWDDLATGRDRVGPVPRTRWDHAALLAASPAPDGRTDCPDGGFLDGIELFDPLFFGLSPSEATAMDPQQRLLLEEAWRALEDAGRAGEGLAGSDTAAFVGTVAGDYGSVLRAAGQPADAHAFMGNAASMTAARVAYHLDLQGPTLSIDTACSSSLVAVHQAADSLRAGACDTALAGGVAVMCSPDFYVAAASAGMLSPTGRCRTLDAAADGFVPGEGVGVFVLRRLADALADGDPIRAVIRASGVNQDGASNGITAPNGAAQTALLRRVYETAGVDPSTVGLVELHGTGTRLGDPIEMEALEAAFAGAAPPEGGWPVGSAKSNIGHALPAAGAAGLAKLVLALQHATRPPSLHLTRVNPLLPALGDRFRAVTRAEPWPAASGPRRGAVSSFGFGGTNAHVVVEEAPAAAAAPSWTGPVAVVLSAASAPALAAYRTALADWLEGAGRAVALGDLAFTLATGRKALRHRAAFVVRDIDGLRLALRDGSAGAAATGSDPWHRHAAAFLAGAPVDWASAFAGSGARRVHAPTTRFERRRCWPGDAVAPARSAGPAGCGRARAITRDLDNPRYAVAPIREAGE